MYQHIPTGKEYLDAAAILKRVRLQPKMHVADFGCGGSAYFALQAAHLVGNKGYIVAIDVYKPALSAAASKARLHGLTNIKFLWSNIEVYRGARIIGDRSLDAGLLINVLHQSRKHREILRECSRMLKPGAKLLLIEWDVTGFGFGPKKEDLLPQQYVEKLAADLGLRLTERFEPSRYHYGLIFTVPTRGPAAARR